MNSSQVKKQFQKFVKWFTLLPMEGKASCDKRNMAYEDCVKKRERMNRAQGDKSLDMFLPQRVMKDLDCSLWKRNAS